MSRCLAWSVIFINRMIQLGIIVFETGENYIQPAVIDPLNGYAYFGCYTTPGRVVKVRLSDFSVVETISFFAGAVGVVSSVIDAAKGLSYWGCATTPGRVVKVGDKVTIQHLPIVGVG